MPTEAPKTIVIYDNTGVAPLASDGLTVVILGETPDGPSLNADNALIALNGKEDITTRLGRNLASNVWIDTLLAFYDLARVPFHFGRITGPSGVKASTGNINDIKGTPAATLSATWRGVGINGNRYSLNVSRGAASTTDTGVGRVDTKLELIETASGAVVFSLDRLTMDPGNPASYAVDLWNAAQTLCTLTDANPNDTYATDDEPVVGTVAFASGADHAAVTTTERQLAVDNLAGRQNLTLALVGTLAWPTTDQNYLLGKAADPQWMVIDYLADGSSPANAQSRLAAINTNPDRNAMHRGWGYWWRNPAKKIPGLWEVLAQAVVAARAGGGRSVNVTGAGQPVNGWISFDSVNESERNAFSQARCNPLYYVNNRYGSGVKIGDVLSCYTGPLRYGQWGIRRADDLILRDVIDYMNNRVLLNPEYPWGESRNDDLSINTAQKVDNDIEALFAQYPNTLLVGGRGQGWEWRFDNIKTDPDGPQPIFLLGTKPAGVARIAYVKIGRVDGRFTVIGAQGAQEV